jgi:hypothetical protein
MKPQKNNMLAVIIKYSVERNVDNIAGPLQRSVKIKMKKKERKEITRQHVFVSPFSELWQGCLIF